MTEEIAAPLKPPAKQGYTMIVNLLNALNELENAAIVYA